jgi:hypothetical protein
MLTDDGQTLAVAESCTGGLIHKRVCAIPGCSKFFAGGRRRLFGRCKKMRRLGRKAGNALRLWRGERGSARVRWRRDCAPRAARAMRSRPTGLPAPTRDGRNPRWNGVYCASV